MYIVAIGWLFVAALASLGAGSVTGGILTFLGFFLPLLLLLWLFGSPARKQRHRRREEEDRTSEQE